MALSLLTPIPATCYTSQLQEIVLSTTAASVTLTITHQAVLYYSGNGQTRVFQATYSTRSNRAKIYDIGSLLETFMLNRDGVQQFYFTFTDGTDTLEETYAVIYCKQQPVRSAADLASSSYITAREAPHPHGLTALPSLRRCGLPPSQINNFCEKVVDLGWGKFGEDKQIKNS